MLRVGRSAKGNKCFIDEQEYKYCLNHATEQVSYYLCSVRKCGARISVENATDNLIGGVLARNNHGNQLLKRTAEKIEDAIIKRSRTNQATAKAVITEIAVKVAAEYGESHLSSIRSSAAIKMKLYREKKKDNPTPEIPTTYKEIIDDLPDNNKTTNTGMFVTIEINS